MLRFMLETGITARTIKMFAFASVVVTLMTAQMSLPPPIELPIVKPWTNDQGERIGTAYQSGNRTYLRNLKGEHIMTVVNEPNAVTMYDPSGNVLKRVDRPQ